MSPNTAPKPLFHHVVILGPGLLGTSLGLALHKHALATTVTGVGRLDSPSLAIAIAHQRGAFDHTATSLADAVRGSSSIPPADLVILCTPVRQFPAAFRELAPALSPGTLVTDVGSTKSDVLAWAAEFLPPSVHFIGSHPMAGSEKSGPAAARQDLYQNAVCLLCSPWHIALDHPPTAAQARIAQPLRDLWQSLGMRLIELPAAVHDRWVAAISHLPHALAFTLINSAARHPEMFAAIAGGFLDTTRIAASDPTMWTDIFLTNRTAILESLDTFSTDLATLRAAIQSSDESTIRAFIARAKKQRESLSNTAHPTHPHSAR